MAACDEETNPFISLLKTVWPVLFVCERQREMSKKKKKTEKKDESDMRRKSLLYKAGLFFDEFYLP